MKPIGPLAIAMRRLAGNRTAVLLAVVLTVLLLVGLLI